MRDLRFRTWLSETPPADRRRSSYYELQAGASGTAIAYGDSRLMSTFPQPARLLQGYPDERGAVGEESEQQEGGRDRPGVEDIETPGGQNHGLAERVLDKPRVRVLLSHGMFLYFFSADCLYFGVHYQCILLPGMHVVLIPVPLYSWTWIGELDYADVVHRKHFNVLFVNFIRFGDKLWRNILGILDFIVRLIIIEEYFNRYPEWTCNL